MTTTAHVVMPGTGTQRRPGARAFIVAVVAVVLALAAVVGWQRLTATSSPAVPASDSLEQAPNRPGGSVYDQQVPAQARHDRAGGLTEGGAILGRQVAPIE
ncbi:MAG: hypothetical protein MUD13_04560 [Candidatus Nanopelagicales bacterium]|jgi:hypothetical protein|nr:hypothetical protein [Candidatus Nanopelagicales bacterium]